MSQKFYVSIPEKDVDKLRLSCVPKDGIQVELDEIETKLVQELISSPAFRKILEKCAVAGYLLKCKISSPRQG